MLSRWFKPNGISVLIAAQNEEKTIIHSVESFLCFADEIIIVTNGSTDKTVELCKQLVRDYPKKVRFYNKPELNDLYHNRAFALSKSNFRWIAKFDADFVAYNDEDGNLSISNLRKRILSTIPFWFISFKVSLINIHRTINQCGLDDLPKKKIYVATPITAMHKIFLNTPFLKFKRIGRWEHIPYNRIYIKKDAGKPSFFHLTMKSDLDTFKRSERTNWRERGEFKLYPTLDDYINNYVLPEKYKTTLEIAINQYITSDLLPYLQTYDEKRYYKYPKRLKRLIDAKKI